MPVRHPGGKQHELLADPDLLGAGRHARKRFSVQDGRCPGVRSATPRRSVARPPHAQPEFVMGVARSGWSVPNLSAEIGADLAVLALAEVLSAGSHPLWGLWLHVVLATWLLIRAAPRFGEADGRVRAVLSISGRELCSRGRGACRHLVLSRQ